MARMLTGNAKSKAGWAARFEELRVWQSARELARAVYRAARTQPLGGDYALAGQIKRAAISVSSNIAEGYERGSRKQQIEFCYIAKGSAGETRSLGIVAHDVGLIDDQVAGELAGLCDKCSRQLSAYLRHLRQTQGLIRGDKFADVTQLKDPSGDGRPPSHVPTFPPSHARGDSGAVRGS